MLLRSGKESVYKNQLVNKDGVKEKIIEYGQNTIFTLMTMSFFFMIFYLSGYGTNKEYSFQVMDNQDDYCMRMNEFMYKYWIYKYSAFDHIIKNGCILAINNTI